MIYFCFQNNYDTFSAASIVLFIINRMAVRLHNMTCARAGSCLMMNVRADCIEHTRTVHGKDGQSAECVHKYADKMYNGH